MIDLEKTQRRIDRFPALCRQAGLKVTPQRSAVYAMLASTDTHPSPETIFSSVREGLPNISQGTVYKVLDLLTERGLLVKVATPGQVARYDARTEPHYHAVCIRCGGIEDVQAEAAPPVPRGDPDGGFDVHKVDVVLQGLCRNCRAPDA